MQYAFLLVMVFGPLTMTISSPKLYFLIALGHVGQTTLNREVPSQYGRHSSFFLSSPQPQYIESPKAMEVHTCSSHSLI